MTSNSFFYRRSI